MTVTISELFIGTYHTVPYNNLIIFYINCKFDNIYLQFCKYFHSIACR